MNQPQQTGQVPPGIPPQPKTPKPIGPIVGIVVIVIILIIGGFYLWGERLVKNGYPGNGQYQTENAAPEPQNAALEKQGTSDTASSIEADLKATDLDSLDSGFDSSAL